MAGVVFIVAALTFLIQTGIPGDAAEARVGPRPDLLPQQREKLVEDLRHGLGLDKPLPVRFGIWLEHAARFDFGVAESGQSVRGAVAQRLLPSLELAFASMLLALPVALLLAVWSARRGGRGLARLVNGVVVAGFVIPAFWLGILLVLVFAVSLKWLPGSGYASLEGDPVGHLRRLALPTLTLAIPQVALYYRYLQESLRSALRSQYVRTARAKGLAERAVLYRHALPNALLPTLTILGVHLGTLIGGVVVVEQIFAWPGVGYLLLYSANRSDYDTVVAVVLAIAVFYVVVSTLVDLLYQVLDPRLRRA
jgi:peptide/nickel transport system permease protein